MRNLLIVIAIALLSVNYGKAQGVSFSDIQMVEYETISLSEIDGLTLVNDDDESTALFQNVQFGILGGLVWSTIYGDLVESFGSRIGFHLGVMIMLSLADDWALQVELIYAMLGSDYEQLGYDFGEFEYYRGGGGDITGTVKLDYLIMLIAAKYYITEGLSVEAGPQFGILLSAKDEYEFDGISEEEDVKDQAKGFDFGLSGGVGYEFDMGLYLKARYYLGLIEVNDFDFPTEESWKNSAAFFSVGYFFQ